MRLLTTLFVLLVSLTAPSSYAHAQSADPASQRDGSASVSATKDEVNQLRSEVAAQRQTIEQLKALFENLADAIRTSRGARSGQFRRR